LCSSLCVFCSATCAMLDSPEVAVAGSSCRGMSSVASHPLLFSVRYTQSSKTISVRGQSRRTHLSIDPKVCAIWSTPPSRLIPKFAQYGLRRPRALRRRSPGPCGLVSSQVKWLRVQLRPRCAQPPVLKIRHRMCMPCRPVRAALRPRGPVDLHLYLRPWILEDIHRFGVL